MKRISKSISTQIACRPRHVVASGESSQVKSGRRRSRLAPLAPLALLAAHFHSACSVYLHCFAVHLHHSPPELCLQYISTPSKLQCIYTLLAVLLCSASLLAAHLCPTLPNLPRELCLQYICAPLCTTCHSSDASLLAAGPCLQCLDTCCHYITTISPNLIVTSSPTILF